MCKRCKNEHEQELAESLNDALVYWRNLYDSKDTLKPRQKERLIRLCQCITQLEPIEQTALTEKYFNLKPLNSSAFLDSYWNRKQTDAEIAIKLNISKVDYTKLRRLSVQNLQILWNSCED